MPSAKGILASIRVLNNELETLLNEGLQLSQQVDAVDFTSVTDVQTHERLESEFNITNEMFVKVNNMKTTLLEMLQRKVIQTMNANPPNSRTRSAYSAKSSRRTRSSRKSLRAKSI